MKDRIPHEKETKEALRFIADNKTQILAGGTAAKHREENELFISLLKAKLLHAIIAIPTTVLLLLLFPLFLPKYAIWFINNPKIFCLYFAPVTVVIYWISYKITKKYYPNY